MTDPRHILLYGDVDLRYTDGSAIWLISMARALTATNSRVTLLLKSPLGTGGLFTDLARIEGLEIVDDFTAKFVGGPRYRPQMASRRIESIVVERSVDVVVCRGFDICREVAKLPNAGPRLWAYMTDIPQSALEMTNTAINDLSAVATSARRIFAQTDEAREFLEYYVAPTRRKIVLLPPMVPNDLHSLGQKDRRNRPGSPNQPLQMVYAGKFARKWNTLEMCELPQLAADYGFSLELTMIGDKFQNDPEDTEWADRMRTAVTNSTGVRWLGSLSREATLLEIADHDIGITWRSPELDSSHEISTKLLEYMACGVPPVVNRTVMHEELLGADYPLYVDNGDVVAALKRAFTLNQHLNCLRESVRGGVKSYWVNTRAKALELAFEQAEREIEGLPIGESLEAVLFCSNALAELIHVTIGRLPGINTRQHKGDDDVQALSANSIVIADTASTPHVRNLGRPIWLIWDENAASTARPGELDIAGMLTTTASFRKAAAWWANIPSSQVFVLPVCEDLTAERPKLSSSRHTLGAIIEQGSSWEIREAHRLVKELRENDDRYNLRLLFADSNVTELRPWDREMILDAVEDLARDPSTIGAWSLGLQSGSDTWLREVGCILYSHEESLVPILGREHSTTQTTTIRLSPNTQPNQLLANKYAILNGAALHDPRGQTTALEIRAESHQFPNRELVRLLNSAMASAVGSTTYRTSNDTLG